jgi:Capsule assembly protein Wzi
VLALLLVISGALHAQRAATIPASSDVYDRLEAVAARFPARGVHLGHRPMSRGAVARVVARLTQSIESSGAARAEDRRWALEQLDYVSRAVEDEPSGAQPVIPRFTWRAAEMTNNAPREAIQPNGLGIIVASTQAFGSLHQGEPAGWGTTVEIVPTGVVGLGRHLALVAEPHIGLMSLRETDSSLALYGSRVYVRGVAGNVALEVGSDDRRWGQSPDGALFISGNAAPMPAIAVSADTAFTLPWLFRYAGPLRATIFLADLGRHQVPSHARLAGWQVSMQPWSRMELGVSVLAQTGGNGGPRATFAQRLVDLFPIIDALSPAHSDLQFSNKLAGGNLLVRIPELSALELYYELQIDDFDARRLKSSLTDDAAHLLGVRLPTRLTNGELTWRAEWHRTSLRLYEHAQFLSGVTYDDHIIGDPIGPNAAEALLGATWQRTPVRSFNVSVVDEWRNPSQYTVSSTQPRDAAFRFVRLTHDPDLRRIRVLASDRQLLGRGSIEISAGYNRAWRSGGPGRNEWMGAVAVSADVPRAF